MGGSKSCFLKVTIINKTGKDLFQGFLEVILVMWLLLGDFYSYGCNYSYYGTRVILVVIVPNL
jgi:hypothetical protein